MDGYSVTEAASVLGVPTERVWELLARGVLSGTPDGETGMRVFLQPRPAPPAVNDAPPSNGHSRAREADVEASPFRELLTEFRNLTERYGQALLALGEARGEVASLRSRVDVLEARMDLRLPMGAETAWTPPAAPPPRAPEVRPIERPAAAEEPATPAPPPAAEAAVEVDQEAVEVDQEGVEVDHEAERAGRRKRGRPHFSDDFARALARAEDPNPAVLPGAEEAGAAFAALQEDQARGEEPAAEEVDTTEAALPRELPAAEPIAVAEPVSEAEAVAEAEAEAIADAEPLPEVEVAAEPELDLEVEAMPAAEPEPEIEPTADAGPLIEAVPEEEAPGEHAVPEATAASGVEVPTALETEPEPAEPEIEPEVGPAIELVLEQETSEEQVVAETGDVPAAEARPEPEPQPDRVPEGDLAALLEPAEAPEVEPEPALEAAGDVEAAADGIAAFVPPPEPEAMAEPEPGAEPEPEPTLEAAPEPDREPEPELEPVPEVEEVSSAVEQPEPTWDQQRYTTEIEEADWWTPEDSVWTEPVAQPAPAPAPGQRLEPEQIADEAGATEEPAAAEAPTPEPQQGEETMLWFGGRSQRQEPAGWPSDDAAGEMEVASTGRRERGPTAFVTDLPGSDELDEAMASLDAVAPQRGTIDEPESEESGATANLLERQPAPARRELATGPRPTESGPVVSAELRSPASRAYRRLRRIFPG